MAGGKYYYKTIFLSVATSIPGTGRDDPFTELFDKHDKK